MSLTTIIDATAAAVAQDTANATAPFAASGRLTTGVATEIQAGRHTLVIDEPPTLGGEDVAPNPVDFALASLISCQVVTYRFWADKPGIAVDTIDVSAVGDLDVRGFFGLDEGVRSGFGEVRLDVRLAGPESEERYRDLKAAVDAHCPTTAPCSTCSRIPRRSPSRSRSRAPSPDTRGVGASRQRSPGAQPAQSSTGRRWGMAGRHGGR